MAREVIDVGVAANDGSGEPLRNAMIKVNNMFEELYSDLGTTGWGYYKDSETTTPTQTINTTPSILQIDGLGANSDSSQLPLEIFGISELWAGNKVTAIGNGDGYDIRLDLQVTSKTSNPNVIDFVLDIGGGAGITIPVVEIESSIEKAPPFSVTVVFPIFTLGTFITNGGQFFLSTDTGSVTVTSRAVLIKRDHKAR